VYQPTINPVTQVEYNKHTRNEYKSALNGYPKTKNAPIKRMLQMMLWNVKYLCCYTPPISTRLVISLVISFSMQIRFGQIVWSAA